MRFYKTQANGNDFCIFGSPSTRKPPDKTTIRKICDRHYGVGCDCAIYIEYSKSADYFMHVYNPDGFEAEICGNALRCSAKYVKDNGYFSKSALVVDTNCGERKISINDYGITVEIGTPTILGTDQIIFNHEMIPCIFVSMGNPHCVLFVNELSNEDFLLYGRKLENHPFFPNGTNVEFAKIINEHTVEMRVWERGIGETLSCSTGSCACIAAANALGYNFKECDVVQLGGTNSVIIDNNNCMKITGECTTVFKGTFID